MRRQAHKRSVCLLTANARDAKHGQIVRQPNLCCWVPAAQAVLEADARAASVESAAGAPATGLVIRGCRPGWMHCIGSNVTGVQVVLAAVPGAYLTGL